MEIIKDMTTNFVNLEHANGGNFTRWQKKDAFPLDDS